MPPADNSRYLAEASRRRRDQARDRAARAIEAAAGRGAAPTVSGIAAAAGVSRSWLYTQDDPGNLTASLARFIGSPAYGPAELRGGFARFRFLLGITDGEGLFSPGEQ